MNKENQIKEAQQIVNECLYKVEDVIEESPLTVKIKFTGNKSIRLTGKFASDIIKAGKEPEYKSTGRMVSDKPNLQNIPIRTEEGNKIKQTILQGTKKGD